MTIRENTEKIEKEILSPYATQSVGSRGREVEEEPCDIRPVFQRDRDRILHCKAFRRLKNKTQVFLTPKGDHYRTRMSHTLEVSQNARTIAKALRLNEDLVEAIALGHDLGHTPFGHAGEHMLDSLCQEGFRHNEQSVRIVERLEKDGKGLNLTWEVRDGILNHQTRTMPHTLEGKIVRLSDKIAYINHDIDDAIRGGIIRNEDIPERLLRELGRTHGKRIDHMVIAMIDYGERYHEIGMDAGTHEAMMELRSFMFENVYLSVNAKGEEARAQSMLGSLYQYFIDHPEELPEDYQRLRQEGDSVERVSCDYIACMTDRYSISTYRRLFIPKSWNKLTES